MRIYDPAGNYTPDEVVEALEAVTYGTREFEFRFERLTATNTLIDTLDAVAACEVSNNQFADIKRVAKFTIKDGGAINYLSDRIKPYVRLRMPVIPTVPAEVVYTQGFEAGIDSWVASGTAGFSAAAQSSALAHSGTYSLSSTTASSVGTKNLTLTSPSQPLEVGETYTVVGWVAASADLSGSALEIQISDTFEGSWVTAPVANTWYRIEFTFVATQTTQEILFSGHDTASGAVTFYLDDVTLTKNEIVDPRPGYVEWSQGVFLLSTPSRAFVAGASVMREVEGYDQLLVLRDDKVSNRTTFTSGSLYTSNITAITSGLGFATNITPSVLTLPSDMEWEPGTSRLQILNDLLGSINYQSAFFDEDGVLVCQPYISPADRASEYTYRTNEAGLISGDVTQTLDLFSVPNKWVIVVSNPDQSALTSEFTNSSLSSPTSTVSRGRTIVDFRTEEDAADQTTLDAKVARIAFEASQVYEVVTFPTAMMPVHQNADVYSLDIDGLSIDAAYSEHEWSMTLKAGATMTHKVRRVVTVS